MHYLYKITNTLNNKLYIGQTVDNKKRWMQHKSYAKSPDKTGQYIHRAMAKHGVENFAFEMIATCQTQEDANEIESLLIVQYNSRDQNHGYNLMVGGAYGGHSEESKQKQSISMKKAYERKGNWNLGTKRTDEQKATLSYAQQNRNNDYTPEIRQRMSEAHIGIKDSDETKEKKSESAKEAWEKRQNEMTVSGELKCNAPGCETKGINVGKYYIIDDIRYCNKHAQRLMRTGLLELLPRSSHNKGKPMSEEAKIKSRLTKIKNQSFL